jgi:CRP/FNR family transcriptional regulator
MVIPRLKMDDFKIFKNWLTQVSFLTQEDCSLFEPYLKTKNYKAREYFFERKENLS